MKSFDDYLVLSLSNRSYRYFLPHYISSLLPLFTSLFFSYPPSLLHPSLPLCSPIPIAFPVLHPMCLSERTSKEYETLISRMEDEVQHSHIIAWLFYRPTFLPSFLNLIDSRILHLILVIASNICYFVISLFFASSFLFFSFLPPLLFLSLCTYLYHYFNIHFLSFFVLFTVDSEGLSYSSTRDSDHQFYS
jgi:hypothetical protein